MIQKSRFCNKNFLTWRKHLTFKLLVDDIHSAVRQTAEGGGRGFVWTGGQTSLHPHSLQGQVLYSGQAWDGWVTDQSVTILTHHYRKVYITYIIWVLLYFNTFLCLFIWINSQSTKIPPCIEMSDFQRSCCILQIPENILWLKSCGCAIYRAMSSFLLKTNLTWCSREPIWRPATSGYVCWELTMSSTWSGILSQRVTIFLYCEDSIVNSA